MWLVVGWGCSCHLRASKLQGAVELWGCNEIGQHGGGGGSQRRELSIEPLEVIELCMGGEIGGGGPLGPQKLFK